MSELKSPAAAFTGVVLALLVFYSIIFGQTNFAYFCTFLLFLLALGVEILHNKGNWEMG